MPAAPVCMIVHKLPNMSQIDFWRPLYGLLLLLT